MSVLKLISTPIGNIEDITLRAIQELKNTKYILAEDTRVLKKLLEQLDIDYSDKKIDSFHDHSQDKVSRIVSIAKSGTEVSLVSDAGSPIVSDPAFPLVRAFLEASLEIKTIPGVSSTITSLELSGLPPAPFTFHGFLPRTVSQVIAKLSNASEIVGTHIFFESPHRIEKTLAAIRDEFPLADVALCRELTKNYESTYRFKASDFDITKITVKGEFVLLLNFGTKERKSNTSLEKIANQYMHKKTPKNLSKLLAEILDISVSEAYNQLSK